MAGAFTRALSLREVGMRLSDVSSVGNITVVRDGTFDTLGFLSRPEPAMLVFVEQPRFLASLKRVPEVSCVITTREIAKMTGDGYGLALSEAPRWAFHQIHAFLATPATARPGRRRSSRAAGLGDGSFYWQTFKNKIDPSARIHPRAIVATRNVRIGAGTVVEANAVISERCVIGAHVIIRSGAILGSAGFLSVRSGDQVEELVHAGGVTVDDGAHILANAVVAPAIFHGSTRIGPQARIGNCACVSHNAQVGARSYVGHGSVVCGFVHIGSDVWIGPGATLTNNISVGDRANVTLGAVVIRDVNAGQRVAGNFAVAHRALLKHVATLH